MTVSGCDVCAGEADLRAVVCECMNKCCENAVIMLLRCRSSSLAPVIWKSGASAWVSHSLLKTQFSWFLLFSQRSALALLPVRPPSSPHSPLPGFLSNACYRSLSRACRKFLEVRLWKPAPEDPEVPDGSPWCLAFSGPHLQKSFELLLKSREPVGKKQRTSFSSAKLSNSHLNLQNRVSPRFWGALCVTENNEWGAADSAECHVPWCFYHSQPDTSDCNYTEWVWNAQKPFRARCLCSHQSYSGRRSLCVLSFPFLLDWQKHINFNTFSLEVFF